VVLLFFFDSWGGGVAGFGGFFLWVVGGGGGVCVRYFMCCFGIIWLHCCMVLRVIVASSRSSIFTLPTLMMHGQTQIKIIKEIEQNQLTWYGHV
jgi:hypothetical protein